MNGDKLGWFQIPIGIILIILLAPVILVFCALGDLQNVDLRRCK